MALANYTDLQASVASWLNRTDVATLVPDWIALCEADMQARCKILEFESTARIIISAYGTGNLPSDFAGMRSAYWGGVPVALVSITRISANVAEATTSAPNNLVTGQVVAIFGATESAYNEQNTAVTVISPTVFRYTTTNAIVLAASIPGYFVQDLGYSQALQYITPEQFDGYRSWGAGEVYFYTISGTTMRTSNQQSGTAVLTYNAKFVPLATSATNSLLTNFPDAYLYGSLMQGNSFIQDEESTAKYKALFEQALTRVNQNSQDRKYAGATLTVRSE